MDGVDRRDQGITNGVLFSNVDHLKKWYKTKFPGNVLLYHNSGIYCMKYVG